MLKMTHLQKVYRTHLIETHALRDFSIHVREGEFVAVTGPSGSGKTTFLNIAGLLEEFTGGEFWLDGVDVHGMNDNERSRLRNEKIGFIFQSFNLIPDLNLFDNVDVPLRYRGFNAADRKQRIEEALSRVGLASRQKHYPAELSGGQQQRVAIARALALEPKLVVADEPTSALDVSIQAQIVNLMADLQERLGLSYLLISHDLAVVRELADRVAVLYAGRLFELAPADDLYARPNNPYTKALLGASPIPDPVVERHRERIVLRGEIPNPAAPPSGCRFHTRCPIAQDRCSHEQPPLEEKHAGQWSACWFT